MRQQLRCLMSLLGEIKLKLKEGTHRTPFSVRLSKILTLPMCVTEAIAPFSSLTRGHNSSDGSEK
jgi:hypothetical protein